MNEKNLCPCHSGKLYKECCQPFHSGVLPTKAVELMRSRYSAYALGLADYLMDTSHPLNPRFTPNREKWRKEILQFSHSTTFEDLKIGECIDEKTTAYVTFTAYLKQGKQDVSFKEKSRFLKENDKWLYVDGQPQAI